MGILAALADMFGEDLPDTGPVATPAVREATPPTPEVAPDPIRPVGVPTAHVEYAYNPRQGAMSNGSYHAILDQPLHCGRLHRETRDALCKPARKFWGLNPGHQDSRVDCVRCLELMARHDITIRPEPALPF